MLTDFGLAKQFKEDTRSNSMCGTVEYMSPEIILGKGHDKAADWWSVGILLFEMLTGKVSIFIHVSAHIAVEQVPFVSSLRHYLIILFMRRILHDYVLRLALRATCCSYKLSRFDLFPQSLQTIFTYAEIKGCPVGIAPEHCRHFNLEHNLLNNL